MNKIKKTIRNQQGISLVEVLAVLIITILIGSILFSVIINGQKQYNNQSHKNIELSNTSYQLKVFTKDLRKSSKVTWDDSTSTLKLDNNQYIYENNTILKDGNIYIDNIQMNLVKVPNSSTVSEINIVVNNEVSTTIVLRRGNN